MGWNSSSAEAHVTAHVTRYPPRRCSPLLILTWPPRGSGGSGENGNNEGNEKSGAPGTFSLWTPTSGNSCYRGLKPDSPLVGASHCSDRRKARAPFRGPLPAPVTYDSRAPQAKLPDVRVPSPLRDPWRRGFFLLERCWQTDSITEAITAALNLLRGMTLSAGRGGQRPTKQSSPPITVLRASMRPGKTPVPSREYLNMTDVHFHNNAHFITEPRIQKTGIQNMNKKKKKNRYYSEIIKQRLDATDSLETSPDYSLFSMRPSAS